jgi:nucleoside-diphosphate-sugar epimerase
LGNPRAIGEAFHITSDEIQSWDQIHRTLAHTLGREAHIVHVPSELIGAHFPERAGGLLGDKAHSVIFDNTKIRRFVPGFRAVIPYPEGLRRSLAWHDADPARKIVSPAADAEIDSLLAVWRAAGGSATP